MNDEHIEKLLAGYEKIMQAESKAGYLSGSRGIAETAIDVAIPILHEFGRLSDDDLIELENRGSWRP